MYSKLNTIYEKNRLDMFVMAMSYIVDKGYETVKEITDEDIDSFKGNALMTEDFCKALVRLAREICQATENGIELYQFATANDLFEVEYFTNGEKYSVGKLEEIARLLLEFVFYDEDTNFNSVEEAKEFIADYLMVEVEDIDKLLEKY